MGVHTGPVLDAQRGIVIEYDKLCLKFLLIPKAGLITTSKHPPPPIPTVHCLAILSKS